MTANDYTPTKPSRRKRRAQRRRERAAKGLLGLGLISLLTVALRHAKNKPSQKGTRHAENVQGSANDRVPRYYQSDVLVIDRKLNQKASFGSVTTAFHAADALNAGEIRRLSLVWRPIRRHS